MGFLHILRIVLASTLLFTSVSGNCHTPRVRKEWRAMCPDERASWINAVKCLTELPHDPNIVPTYNTTLALIPPLNPNSSYYDDFVYVHMDLNPLIHGTGFFFPWHRLYVQTFEDNLRSKCGYSGVNPYWDWTKDTADFYHTTMFSDSTYDGLGSWGDPENDFQISTGGLKDIVLAYPVPHHIRRNFTLQPLTWVVFPGLPPPLLPEDPLVMVNTTFTEEVVNTTVNSWTGDYIKFHEYVEGFPGPHPGPHYIVGGDLTGMCPFGLTPPGCNNGPRWSPNDPLFFLHHAMIDKIWFDWQRRDPSNKGAFAGGSVSGQMDPSLVAATYPTGGPPFLSLDSAIPGMGLWENITVRDVLDTTGGILCYVYA